MSAKPTPGPANLGSWIRRYFGEDAIEDDAVDVTIDGLVKMIGALEVDEMAAIEKLKRIRGILERPPLGETMRDLRKELLSALEAKP